MTPQSQIQTLESLGVTRYRIACDTGLSEATLHRVVNQVGKMTKLNAKILNEYYEKLIKSVSQ